NPIKVDIDRLRDAVAAAESAAGWAKSVWLETSEADPGIGQARQALQEGVDVVLAAGGDGTVRAVAQGLQNTGVALALLPSGTGNLLARNIGLDVNASHMEASVELAFTGVDQAIDVGVIEIDRPDGSSETHSFVAIARRRLAATTIADTNPEPKRRFRRLAYVDSFGRSHVDKQVPRLRYRLAGGEERCTRVHTILVGNCGALPG